MSESIQRTTNMPRYTKTQHTTKQNTKQMPTVRTPFCRWCKDHGKSKQVYTSHYPRDLDGNTICPDILSQTCGHCQATGHTKGSCPRLAQQKRERRIQEKSTKQDEDGFVTVSWRAKGHRGREHSIVAVACISGFTGLGEDKPVEIDWETDFQTPAEAYGKTKKPAITSVWGDMEEDMDYNEKITWD